MNNYNFDDKNSKSKKSILAFTILLIIVIAAYVNNEQVAIEIKNIEEKIETTIEKVKGESNSNAETLNSADSTDEKAKVPSKNSLENSFELTNVKKKVLNIPKKKQVFLDLLVAPIQKVYKEFDVLYKEIKENPNDERIQALQKAYKVSSYEELLYALKPHPKSIALAQAAMESAWASSRFFKEANNIFGVWSFNKNEPRIAASQLRGEQTIWLKKYTSIEESVRDYYKTLSRSKAFKAFRVLNYEEEYQNPYLLTVKLDKYSEKGALYGEELNSMISFNKFTRFDEKEYPSK